MSTAIVPYVARKSASLIAARYARAYLMRNKVAITRQALRSGIRFYKYAGAKIGLAAKRYLARRESAVLQSILGLWNRVLKKLV